MKKALVLAFIVVIFSLILAGCGGGAPEESSTPSTDSQQTQTTTATPTGTSSATTSTETPKAKVPRKFEFTKDSLPHAFEKALKDSEITIVAFYNPDDSISNKVQTIVEDVVVSPDYADQIKYLSYEISGKTTAAVAKLTTVLGAKFLPNITIIDGNGNIVFEDSGYTNSEYFSHALYNVVYKDKSN